jgi:2-methylcitrate dehydratase PrpD
VFHAQAFGDEAVLRLAAKVGYELDPSIDYPRQFVGDVTVRLRDGRTLHERQDRPRGGPDRPISPADLEAKFRANAALLLPPDTTERIVAEVAELPGRPRIATLTGLLVR